MPPRRSSARSRARTRASVSPQRQNTPDASGKAILAVDRLASSVRPACARPPDDADRLIAENRALAAVLDIRQERPDMLPPRGERGAVEAEALRVDPAPVELRRQEGRFGDRIGNLRRLLGSANSGKRANSAATPVSDGFRQIAVEIAEERERLRARPLLAHEQHRRLRQQEIDARERADRRGRSKRAQPLAEGAVADLVVVLNERDEGAGREVRARPAASELPRWARPRPDRRSPRPAPWPRSFVSP